MYLDILLLILILVFAVSGIFQGFFRQMASIIMWLLILLLADPLGRWLRSTSSWLESAPRLFTWSMAAFLIGFFIIGMRELILISKKNPPLQPVDRWLGLGIGMFKGLVLALLICMGIHLIPAERREQFDSFQKDSRQSSFMTMAEPLLNWNSISAFRELGSIKRKLSEKLEQKNEVTGPWSHEVGIDKN